MISAEVICDSVSKQGKRLTTFKLRYPKFIHGEFMTHRVISRNASSSRAIPTAKLIEEVRSDALCAAPIFWGKNQPGMQAVEELQDDMARSWEKYPSEGKGFWMGTDRQRAKELWFNAALNAASWADRMNAIGVHKQIVNRLLEPFSHINVVATATEWDNFFGLRLHRDAQPEMRALAVAMWEAKKASTIRQLRPGEWHMPFINRDDIPALTKAEPSKFREEIAIKVSVARCARVSYESHETGRRSTVEEDLKLYDRLVGAQPLHASPAEHQATPDDLFPVMGRPQWKQPREHGNFVGWRQYRKMLKGESVAPLPEEFLSF